MRLALRFVGFREKDGALRDLHSVPTGTVFEVPEEGLTVGRSVDAAIRIADGSVARAHARIGRDGDQLRVVDLASTNGTFVNGVRVRGPGVPCRLGDRITLAMGYELEVVEVAAGAMTSPG